ncbi:hypothetical protein [Pseudomonas fluorescens]|uniref:hypothetical protein n=1 Tax=Pseudomonas fluorescens TaxID=294 RepID=UPI0015EC809E|nr:hypothetical protein [Pseudomonas fluorescens]
MIAVARLPLRSDLANDQFERPSTHGRDAFHEASFVAGKIFTHQLAVPGTEEVISLL